MSRPPPDNAASTAWFSVFEELQDPAHRGDIHDRALRVSACRAVLKVVRSQAARAVLDAYTDYRKMPPDVEAAEDALWALGKRQHKRDPGMNVELDLTNAEAWDLLERYAPWSIDVAVYDGASDEIAHFHDCGLLVGARLTVDQAAKLADDLGDALHVESEADGR